MICDYDVVDGKIVNLHHDGGDFGCIELKLKTLVGSPQNIKKGGEFACLGNLLTDLRGCPVIENGAYNFNDNCLVTLEGAPTSVGYFYCARNKLTSLKGAPEEIWGDFDCSGNQLTSLKDGPKKGCYIFNCSKNPGLTDISDIPMECEQINIEGCPHIQKFPTSIRTTLVFIRPRKKIRKIIRKLYDVVDESENNITVCQKNIGTVLLDDL